MGVRVRSLVAIAAVIAAAFPGVGAGQPAPPAPDTEVARTLEGRWVLAIDRGEAQRRVDTAIGSVTRQMVPIVSSIAQRRLRTYNPLAATVEIAFPGDRIRIGFDDQSFDTRAGYEQTVTVPEQEPSRVRVHQAIRGRELVQVFSTDEGRRWNTLSIEDDGTLAFQVVIRSAGLPTDIRYQLPYRRAP